VKHVNKQYLKLHVDNDKPNAGRADAIVLDASRFTELADLRRSLLAQSSDGQPRLLLIEAEQLPELRPFLDSNPLVDFMVKPVSPDELELRLQKFSETVNALDQNRQELTTIQAQVDRLAYYDRVTELPNAEFFRRHLAFQIRHAQRYNRQLAVLAVDLQSFERVQGLLGHRGTRALLASSGRRIVRELRDHDLVGQIDNVVPMPDERLVARVDGDRFMVMVSEFRHIKDVTSIVERLISAISEPIEVEGRELIARPKVGISVFPSDGEDEETLIQHAHAALDFSRDHRLGDYGFFAETTNQLVADRFAVETRLRQAITDCAFELHYQPKVELATGKTVGLEALVRWRDEELGNISPARFIPLAEELGLIYELSRWVVQEACRQSRRWLNAGVPAVPVAVNLSGQDFLRSDFPDFVTNVLLENDIAPQNLELEITEGVVIENLATAAKMLEELRKIGVSIALDDFGTGYSSLGYLHRIPIDTLKIDRSFIRNIADDWNSAAITSGVITLSHILNLNVVAEGVETQEQIDLLLDQNCNAVQGAIYSMPMTPEKTASWLRAEHAQ